MTQGVRSEVIFELTVNKKFKISKDAVVASFSTGLLGGNAIKIYNGDINGPICKNKDTLASKIELGLVESLAPTLWKIKESLTSFINKVDTTFTKDSQKDLSTVISNLKDITENVKKVTLEVNSLVKDEKIKINTSLDNAESITNNLKNNNDDITASIKNLRKSSDELAQADLKKTFQDAQKTLDEMRSWLAKINSGQGTLGMLSNDRKLYDSLLAATTNLNTLLTELQNNPGKYVPFKKNKKK
jgi:phospholipid/cholesterol/gamma-HCH transport system substrate-binding protein